MNETVRISGDKEEVYHSLVKFIPIPLIYRTLWAHDIYKQTKTTTVHSNTVTVTRKYVTILMYHLMQTIEKSM